MHCKSSLRRRLKIPRGNRSHVDEYVVVVDACTAIAEDKLYCVGWLVSIKCKGFYPSRGEATAPLQTGRR